MRLTQGTFSYPPRPHRRADRAHRSSTPSTTAGRSRSNTPTIRIRATPTGRCAAPPMFDQNDAATVLGEVREARAEHPARVHQGQRLRRTLGRQTTALSFIVNRPSTSRASRSSAPTATTAWIATPLRSYAAERARRRALHAISS